MQAINKKAHFNYILLERFEAGMVLNGGEVKAVRGGRLDLSNSYAKVIGDELYLINTSIPVEGKKDYNPTRARKLLLHKHEIITLKTTIKAKKLTLVPTKLYTKGPLIKAEIALAKPKRTFEKKEDLKRKDIEREIEQEFKSRIK